MLFSEKQENQKIKEEIKEEVKSDDGSIIEKEERDDSEVKEEVLSENSSDEDIQKVEKKLEKPTGREFKEDKAVLEGRVVFIRLIVL